MIYAPSGAGWRVGVVREKLSSKCWMDVRYALAEVNPWERAWWR